MNKLLLVFLIFVSLFANAQKSINNYKYIIVTNKFDFLNKPNQHQTSALTKFLFEKNGFNVLLDNEVFPEDLNRDRCLGLTAKVIDDSGFFTTKNKIQLRNCKNEIVFETKFGKSKKKVYKKAYHEAIRKAFISLKALNYKYQSVNQVVIKKENRPVAKAKEESKQEVKNGGILYAQAKSSGYQLVNTKPEIIFEVLKTSNPNIFVLKNKTGVLLNKQGDWFVEYYKEDKLIVERIKLKF